MTGIEIGGCRVLVLENEPETIELLHALLGGVPYEVCYVKTGWDAIRALIDAYEARCPFQVVLADFGTSGLDGITVCKTIRLWEPVACREHRTKLIGFTAYVRDAEEGLAIYSEGLHLEAFIRKPEDIADLPDVIARLLEST